MKFIFDRLQSHLFARHASTDKNDQMPVLFILGSPRAGSTVLYQAIIASYNFATTLIAGLALQRHFIDVNQILFNSKFGKVHCPSPFKAG